MALQKKIILENFGYKIAKKPLKVLNSSALIYYYNNTKSDFVAPFINKREAERQEDDDETT